MKAYIFFEKGKLKLTELPDPVLREGSAEDARSAILKPVYVSPCSSDVHTVYAGAGPRRENLVLGHEGLARVISTGSTVKKIKPGDLVAVSAVMPEPGDKTGHKGSPFSASKLGRNIDGMWSQKFKVPDADINLAVVPEGLSMEAALMCTDMMATGFTAAEEAVITENSTVLIIGSGAVGLMAAAAAVTKGAWRVYIIGTERNKANINAASMYGADAYISYKSGRLLFADEEAMEALKAWEEGKIPHNDERANSTGSAAVKTLFALTKGMGADRVIIAGGGPEAFMQACDAVRYGSGIAVNMAYIEGSGNIGLPVFSLGRGMAGKTFKFCLSRGGSAWTLEMLERAMFMERGGLGLQSPGRLVTHRLKGFDKIPEALSLMRERPDGLIKIMVETGL